MTPTGPLTMFWFITSSSISMSIEILTSSFVLLEIVESLHPVWMLFPPMPCSDLLFQTHNHLKVVDTRIHLHRYSFVFWALAIIDIFRSEVLDPFWIFTSLRPHLYFYSFCSSQFDAQPPSFFHGTTLSKRLVPTPWTQFLSLCPYGSHLKQMAYKPSYWMISKYPLAITFGCSGLSRSNSTQILTNLPRDWMVVTGLSSTSPPMWIPISIEIDH